MKREPEDNLQNNVYAFLAAFIHEQGMPPTIREIGHAMGIESTGHIDQQRGKGRGIKLARPIGVPVLGAIAAGKPIDVFDQTRQEPLELLPSTHEFQKANAFALLVRGQSMVM